MARCPLVFDRYFSIAMKTVVCPEFSLPSDLKANRKAREQTGGERLAWNSVPSSSSSSSSSFSRTSRDSESKSFSGGKKPFRRGGKPLSQEDEQFQAKKEELRTMMRSVKKFNAHSELGKSRKHFIDEQLTRLGAPAVGPEKMPLRVRLRIAKAQEKRETRQRQELKESHEVVASSAMKKRTTNGTIIDTQAKKKRKFY